MLFNIDVLDYSQMGRQGRRVPHGLFFPISFCGSNNAKLIVNNSSGTARVTRTKLPAMLKVAFAAGPAVLVWKMLALWVNLMTGNCSEASVELISTLGVCLWSLLLGWLAGVGLPGWLQRDAGESSAILHSISLPSQRCYLPEFQCTRATLFWKKVSKNERRGQQRIFAIEVPKRKAVSHRHIVEKTSAWYQILALGLVEFDSEGVGGTTVTTTAGSAALGCSQPTIAVVDFRVSAVFGNTLWKNVRLKMPE